MEKCFSSVICVGKLDPKKIFSVTLRNGTSTGCSLTTAGIATSSTILEDLSKVTSSISIEIEIRPGNERIPLFNFMYMYEI